MTFLSSFYNLQASIFSHFSVFPANLSSQMAAAMRSHRFTLLSEKESGPGNSRLNREKGVLLAWSGTAPPALQARWLIWFQCLVLTLAWQSTLCHLLLSAWADVAHVASDWLMGLILKLWAKRIVRTGDISYEFMFWHWLLHIKIYIFVSWPKATKKTNFSPPLPGSKPANTNYL